MSDMYGFGDENDRNSKACCGVSHLAERYPLRPKVIAFDSETERMSYHTAVPELMCLTHSEAGSNSGSIVTPWDNSIDTLVKGWWDAGHHTVAHNTAFDLSVLAWKYPHLLPDIFKALDNGLIHDTLLREKLLNITLHGDIEKLEVNGAYMQIRYALIDLEKKYLNLDRSDLKDQEDSPRTNYSILKNVSLTQWPEEYISYAVDDAINCGQIFEQQEIERQRCIDRTGYDPFVTEAFRTRVSFALRLIECTGSLLDGEMVEKVAAMYREDYNKPALRDPLLAAGLLLPEVPPQPYANGAQEHVPTCRYLDKKVSKKNRDKNPCGCPPKMKAAEAEKSPTRPLFQIIWNLARTQPDLFKAWPSDGCISSLKQAGIYDKVISAGAFRKDFLALHDVIPDDITLTADAEWAANFAALDPLLTAWDDRKKLRKIITDYLPKMYYTDPVTGITAPAKLIRGGFNALVLTGRSSCRAPSLYPGRNEQNVDPRVRPCTIPREGNCICSTDYNGMELGTLAQKCINLFGYSELANKINAGIDVHAYLAAQIANSMDDAFRKICQSAGVTSKDNIYGIFYETKGLKESLEAEMPAFTAVYRHENPDLPADKQVTWGDFFGHYRTLAKPVGLGYPGGLGAATLVTVAKASYGLTFSVELARKLKVIWLETFPEMGPYLDHISKHSIDPNHATVEYEDDDGKIQKRIYYCYDTPRGMHRSKCGFCEAANGTGLQAFSAEGALEGLYRVTKAFWLAEEGDLLYGCMVIGFIHDEILWESPKDDLLGKRVRAVEKVMVEAMSEITPDVKAGASSAAMLRWDKKAKGLWKNEGTDTEQLIIWEKEK